MAASSDTKPSGGGFLANVESIRGIAALYVAFWHVLGLTIPFNYHASILSADNMRDLTLRFIATLINGQTAVVVFFVISGFVIGRSLDRKDSVLPAAQSYALFMLRRALRLYPAHIVALLGIVALAWLFLMHRPRIDFTAFPMIDALSIVWLNAEPFNHMTWRTVATNLTMGSWSLNMVVWSLYVELAVVPALPIFHKLTRAGNLYLDLAIVGGLIALTIFNWDHLWSRYWFAFYLGMMVQTHGRRWSFLLERAMVGRWPAIAVSYAVLVLPLGFTDGGWVAVVIQVLGAFSLLSLIVWCDAPRLQRALEHPVLRWNGRISYSFYLWHFFLFSVFAHHLYARFTPETLGRYEIAIFFGVLIVTVALACGLAQLSFVYVERPFLRLGRAIETRWQAVVARRRSETAAAANAALGSAPSNIV